MIHFFATHGTNDESQPPLRNKGFAAIAGTHRGRRGFISVASPTSSPRLLSRTNRATQAQHRRALSRGPTRSEFDNLVRTRLCSSKDAFTQLWWATPIGSIDARFTMSISVLCSCAADTHQTVKAPHRASDVWRRGVWQAPTGFHETKGETAFWGQTICAMYRLARLSGSGCLKACDARACRTDTHVVQSCSRSARANRCSASDPIGIPGEPTIVAGLRLRRVVASIIWRRLADINSAWATQHTSDRDNARRVSRTALRAAARCSVDRTVPSCRPWPARRAMRDGRSALGRRPRLRAELGARRALVGRSGAGHRETLAHTDRGQAVEAVSSARCPITISAPPTAAPAPRRPIRREGAGAVADDGSGPRLSLTARAVDRMSAFFEMFPAIPRPGNRASSRYTRSPVCLQRSARRRAKFTLFDSWRPQSPTSACLGVVSCSGLLESWQC